MYLLLYKALQKQGKKKFDRDRTRTCNPQIRSLMPYPLGHTTLSFLLCLTFSNSKIRYGEISWKIMCLEKDTAYIAKYHSKATKPFMIISARGQSSRTAIPIWMWIIPPRTPSSVPGPIRAPSGSILHQLHH